MSSGYSPWFHRNVLYKIPGLFVKCQEGNYHPRWRSRVCFCVDDCDLMDMKTGKKYVSMDKYDEVLKKLWDDGPVQAAYLGKRKPVNAAPQNISSTENSKNCQ